LGYLGTNRIVSGSNEVLAIQKDKYYGMEQPKVSQLADILRAKKKTNEEIIRELEMIIQQQMMYGGDIQNKLEGAIARARELPFVYP
jgi:hypothetical protein